MSAAELAGGFGGPAPIARVEDSFRRRLDPLPADTRRLLQLAAADPVGEPLLVWRAAERLGIGREAAAAAVDAGLFEIGAQVRFRHPCVRSAAYRSASPEERQRGRTPRWPRPPTRGSTRTAAPGTAPRRRPARTRRVAEELERSAGRALARGGVAAAAAFLEHAAMLTPEPARPRAAPARRGAGEARRGRARRGAGAAGRGRGRPGRRAAGGGDRAAARRDRVRPAPRRRGGPTAHQRGPAPRRARRRARAHHAPEGARRGDVGRTGRAAGGGRGGAGRAAGPGSPRTVDLLRRRVRGPRHGRATPRPRRCSGERSTPCSRSSRRRRRPLAVAHRVARRRDRRDGAVGRRRLARAGRRATCRSRATWARSCCCSSALQSLVRSHLLGGDLAAAARAHRGGAGDRRGDRDLARRLHRDAARGLARPGGLTAELIARETARGERARDRPHRALRDLRGGGAQQRARPLRRRAGGGAARRSSTTTSATRRSSCPSWPRRPSRTGDAALLETRRAGSRRARAARPSDWALGIEARVRALAGEEPRRRYRESIERLARTRVAAGARPLAAALRGVAAPRGPARRRARAAAGRARGVPGDGRGGLRRARAARAAGHRREGPQAPRRHARRADAAGGAHRAAGARRADEPGDRRRALPQPAHRRVAPEEGVHQARHQLAPRAARRAARRSRTR